MGTDAAQIDLQHPWLDSAFIPDAKVDRTAQLPGEYSPGDCVQKSFSLPLVGDECQKVEDIPAPAEHRSSEQHDLVRWSKLSRVLTYAIILMAATSGIVCLSSLRSVGTWECGIVTVFGRVVDPPLTNGMHFVHPSAVVHHVSLRIQCVTVTASAPTSDAITVAATAAVLFRVQGPEWGQALFIGYGADYPGKIVAPYLKSELRSVTSKLTPNAFYTSNQRVLIERETKRAMAQKMGRLGIVVEDVVLLETFLPETISAAIERKASAIQANKTMQYILEIERKERERKEIESYGISIFQNKVSANATDFVLKWNAINKIVSLASTNNTIFVILSTNGLPIVTPQFSEYDTYR